MKLRVAVIGMGGIGKFQWIIGRMPKIIFGAINTLAHDMEVEDVATATMIFDGGIQATIQMSTIDHPTIFGLALRGEKAYAEFDDNLIKVAYYIPSIRENSKLQDMWATPEAKRETIEEPKEEGKMPHELAYGDFLDS